MQKDNLPFKIADNIIWLTKSRLLHSNSNGTVRLDCTYHSSIKLSTEDCNALDRLIPNKICFEKSRNTGCGFWVNIHKSDLPAIADIIHPILSKYFLRKTNKSKPNGRLDVFIDKSIFLRVTNLLIELHKYIRNAIY